MIFLQLFYEFFKTGLFAVGGGLATLPFLSDMADKTHWFTQDQLADMIAISESTPGPIGVNMATYAGYITAGVPGAIVATLGLITPSVIIILIIAGFLKQFRENKYVDAAFYALRAASTAFIAVSGISVVTISLLDVEAFKNSGLVLDLFNIQGIILAAVILFCTKHKKLGKLHPIVWIALSAVVGIVFNFAGV